MSISNPPLARSDQSRIRGKDIPTVAVAHGDGTGPEIMTATLSVLIKTERLCLFDGTPGFSLGQGQ